MTTRTIYDTSNVRHRDFAMPVQEIVDDERDYCQACQASLTSTDYEAGACTQCGEKIDNDQEKNDEP